MINIKQNLKNFDLYPFATIATDSTNSIVYKNQMTKTMYPSIHIGAKLSAYINIDSSFVGIVRSEFTVRIQLCSFTNVKRATSVI